MLIKFSIGNYRNEVLCDVVPMEVAHVLPRRPWEYDEHTFHDGKIITILPLTPKEVNEDQTKMQIKKKKREDTSGTKAKYEGQEERHNDLPQGIKEDNAFQKQSVNSLS